MSARIIHIVAVLAWLIVAFPAKAQKAEAVPDRKEIRIGEQVTIRLSVPYLKENPPIAKFPQVGDTLLKNVEVVRKTGIDTLTTGDDVKETRLEQKLYITSFDTGYYAIPPFTFEIEGEKVNTEAFLLTVTTVEIDTTKGIADIREIYETEVGLKDYLIAYAPYIAGGIALAAVLAAVIFLIIRAQKRKSALPPPTPVVKKRPAHLVALEALEKTGREKNYLRGRVKQHHTEITDALRTYIEEIFEIPAHELTSGQIITRLRYSDIAPEIMTKLKRVFTMSDMVKFAKENPEPAENDKSVTDASDFVNAIHRRFADSIQSEEEEGKPEA